jgi:pyruvate,water dikinase
MFITRVHSSVEEILSHDSSHVERARERYDSFRHFRAPNEIGSRFKFDAGAAQGALRGIGASHGTVRGTARVARNIEEAMHVESGSILVCPFTDPGWTPLLDRVVGVVTETGGMLSHAAVICREFGIPAVLGVPEATARIPDGARVVLHGGEGFVELDPGAGSSTMESDARKKAARVSL